MVSGFINSNPAADMQHFVRYALTMRLHFLGMGLLTLALVVIQYGQSKPSTPKAQGSLTIQGPPQLKITLTKISQKNCATTGTDSLEVPVVWLKLALEVKNISNTNLIVSKSIGIAWYTPIVARDGKALADGNYESKLSIEWEQISESKLSTEAPSAEFTILGPSDLFVVERTVDLTVRRDDMAPSLGLGPGDHVLQLDFGTWFHVRPAEPFEEAWRKYGQLVYRPTKSDALPFQIPPESDFVKCRAGGPF